MITPKVKVSKGAIRTSMPSTFPKTTKAQVMSKGPRKMVKGEQSNESGRPPKR